VDFRNLYGVHTCPVSSQTDVTLHPVNSQVAATIVVVQCGKAIPKSFPVNTTFQKKKQQGSNVLQNICSLVVMVERIKKATLLRLAFSAIANVTKGKSHLDLPSIENIYRSGYRRENGTLASYYTLFLHSADKSKDAKDEPDLTI
jgi:hypothetical protein